MDQSTRVNGNLGKDMAEVSKFGLMGLFMMATGRMILLQVKVD